jgi:hypothetical protein
LTDDADEDVGAVHHWDLGPAAGGSGVV